jgi:hypothetical protein
MIPRPPWWEFCSGLIFILGIVLILWGASWAVL